MVAGGWSGSTRLDTTEVYQDNEWRTVSGTLPRPITYIQALTFNDMILSFGIKIILRDNYSLSLKL